MTTIRGETLTALVEYICDHNPRADLSALDEASSLSNLGIDSALTISAVGHCEDYWNIVIPEEAFSDLETIGDVLDAIEQLVAAQPSSGLGCHGV